MGGPYITSRVTNRKDNGVRGAPVSGGPSPLSLHVKSKRKCCYPTKTTLFLPYSCLIALISIPFTHF